MRHPRYPFYLWALLAGCLLPALLWTLLVSLQLEVPTASSQWIYDMYKAKRDIALAMEAPRLVVVSGSSARYNISAQLLEQATGVPTVNLATTGGLGLRYLLEQTQPLLRSGDVVLLAPEYELYQASGAPTSVLLDYVLAQDPGYLKTLSPFEVLSFIFAVPWERVYEGLEAKWTGSLPDTRSYDHLGVLNAYGDETNNKAEHRTHAMATKLAAATPERVLLEGAPQTSLAWRQLADFARWCRANGVTLLASFPSTLYFPEYETSDVQAVLEEIFLYYQRLEVPVLGSPEMFMYPAALMYDTQYHLTDEGMVQNTQKVIGLVSPHLTKVSGSRLGSFSQ